MEKDKKNFVSLIIPAFKQQDTIESDLLRIKHVMDQLRYDYEIVVVVDGMLDKTYRNAKKVKFTKIKVIGYKENCGKGYAIRTGMKKTKGNIIAFIDSGMDINPNGLSMLLEHFQWYNADIIVGSKLHPASKIQYPIQRKILSLGYRVLVKILFNVKIRDTQAGIKFFKKRVIQDVLPRLLVKKYAFDIEILAVAWHLGYKRIYEAPIELDFNGKSSITTQNFWVTIFLMIQDTLAVFYRLHILHYYDKNQNKKYVKS